MSTRWKPLPGEVAYLEDEAVVAVLTGRWLRWTNSVSGKIETAQAGSAKVETTKAGRRLLSFVSDEGFRSVALSAIEKIK